MRQDLTFIHQTFSNPCCFKKGRLMNLAFSMRTTSRQGWQHSFFKNTARIRDWDEKQEEDSAAFGQRVVSQVQSRVGMDWYPLSSSQLHVNDTITDVGINTAINTAFKRRYRRFKRKDAIDKMERCIASDIYKVDQLMTMRWRVAAWNEITDETVQNCFTHWFVWTTKVVKYVTPWRREHSRSRFATTHDRIESGEWIDCSWVCHAKLSHF